MQLGLYPTTRQAVSEIWRQAGARGFYRGYSTTLMREIPFDSMQFFLYESLKSVFYQNGDISAGGSVLAGAFSGAISGFLTNPIDVVKTRLMTQAPNKALQTGSFELAKKILCEEGAKAFMSGVTSRLVWISLGGAIFFGVYEKSRRFFDHLEVQNK